MINKLHAYLIKVTGLIFQHEDPNKPSVPNEGQNPAPDNPPDAQRLPTDYNQQPEQTADEAGRILNTAIQRDNQLTVGGNVDENTGEEDPKVVAAREKTSEQAREYIAINDRINQKIASIKAYEEKTNKSSDEATQALLGITSKAVAIIKSHPKNAKLVEHCINTDAQNSGQARPKQLPAAETQYFFTNYKGVSEPDGGMAIAEDMSDVPDLVKEGNLDFADFKRRTDLFERAATTVEQETKKVAEKYPA